MTDWRYFIAYEGIVEAEDDEAARYAALDAVSASVMGEALRPIPNVEVEEIE